MGCTSQKALQEFGAPTGPKMAGNPNLHVRDWIHTKVYLSVAGAVIGSPNLSAKALGVGGRAPGNLEAGTFHPAGSEAWKEAKAWFDEVFNNSHEVLWDDVKRASKYSNDPGREHDDADLAGLSFLDRIRHYPESFKDLSFIVSTDDLDEEVERALRNSENTEDSSDLSVVVWDEEEGWHDVEKSVIAFHLREDGGRSINGYVRCRASAQQTRLLIFGVEDWKSLRRLHPGLGLKKSLNANDWLLIRSLWEGDQTIFTAAELADALDSAALHVAPA
jgi:hypothetical protein